MVTALVTSSDSDCPVEQLLTTRETAPACEGPLPTVEEVKKCQFSEWYDTFRNVPDYRRSNVTIKSNVLSLPPTFEDYLLSDGVRLPEGATNVSSCIPPESNNNDDWSSDGEKDNFSPEEIADESLAAFSFPELNLSVASAISSLGGSVIPKLNWSAPKDATWMNHGTLKCQTPGDVYLLLKSSDFVLHDVSHAFDKTRRGETEELHEKVTLKLVLRKWCNLNPSMEFRCFVNHHELVAVSQRNHTQHFAHLRNNRTVILPHILEFYDEVVCKRFGQGEIERYCFDLYLDKRDRIWLLDFNVWGVQTDSLLFDWAELVEKGNETIPEFRVVETELEIRQDPLASYRAPIDTINLASMTGGDVTNFEEFMKMCEPPSEIDK